MGNYNDYLEYLKHIDNTTEQEIKAKVDGLNDEITSLKNNVANLTKVKDGLTTDLANANREINGKIDIINIKEIELKKVENDLKQTKNELKETQNKLSELEKVYSLSQEKNTSLSNEISELQKKQSTLKSESDTYQKDLKDTNFKLSELEKLYTKEQSNNASLSNQIAELKSKYSVLETDFKSKNSNAESYISEIQKLHLELESAKNDFKNASASNSSTSEQINKYRSEISNLNKTIEELKKKNNTAELSDLKIKLDKTERELNDIVKNKNLLDSELKTEKERNKNLNDSLIKKNEELKNLEPKNNLKYILGSLAGVFFIASIILFSMYQSSERGADYQFSEYSRVSNELDEKNTALKDIKLSMVQSGKFMIIKDARFKTNIGTGLTFSSSQLRRISPIIEIYSYLDKDTVINIKYDRKEPNGSWTNFSGEGYYVNEKFTINPGNNELEYNGFWGNDDEWSKGTGDFNYTFYSDNLLKNYSKKLSVK